MGTRWMAWLLRIGGAMTAKADDIRHTASLGWPDEALRVEP